MNWKYATTGFFAVLIFIQLIVGGAAAQESETLDCSEWGGATSSDIAYVVHNDQGEKLGCMYYGDYEGSELAHDGLHEEALIIGSGSENIATVFNNYLQVSDAEAFSRARMAVVHDRASGASVEVAKNNATNEVVDYYSLMQKNAWKLQEQQILRSQHMMLDANVSDLSSIISHSTVESNMDQYGDFRVSSVSYTSPNSNNGSIIDSGNYVNHTYTLENGSTVQVRQLVVEATVTYDADSAGGDQYRVNTYVPVGEFNESETQEFMKSHATFNDIDTSDTIDNANGQETNKATNFLTSHVDWRFTVNAPTSYEDNARWYKTYTWETFNQAHSEKVDYAVDNTGNLTEGIYNRYSQTQAQNVTEQFSGGMLTAYDYSRWYANNHNTTGHNAYAEGWFLVHDYKTTLNASMEIDTDGDGTADQYGSVVTRGDIPTTNASTGEQVWKTGYEYNVSNFSKPVLMVEQTSSGSKVEELNENTTQNGTFTITKMTNLNTGEGVNETTPEQYEFGSANNTDVKNAIDQRERIVVQVEQQASNTGEEIAGAIDDAVNDFVGWIEGIFGAGMVGKLVWVAGAALVAYVGLTLLGMLGPVLALLGFKRD